MKELDRPIGRVWRRLRLQRFLASTVWCLAAGLAVATVVLGVEKLGQVPIPGRGLVAVRDRRRAVAGRRRPDRGASPGRTGPTRRWRWTGPSGSTSGSAPP